MKRYGSNMIMRDARRRLGLSWKDYDHLRALKDKNPYKYNLMMSFLQTKINAMGYVIGPHIRYRFSWPNP